MHGISFIKSNGYRPGNKHVMLMTYFHLRIAEAFVDLGRGDEARRHISFSSISPGGAIQGRRQMSLLAEYHKIQGKIYFIEENYNESIKQFSNHLYYAALLFGPRNIKLAVGYFMLGQSFSKQRELRSCPSSFDQTKACIKLVLDIW